MCWSTVCVVGNGFHRMHPSCSHGCGLLCYSVPALTLHHPNASMHLLAAGGHNLADWLGQLTDADWAHHTGHSSCLLQNASFPQTCLCRYHSIGWSSFWSVHFYSWCSSLSFLFPIATLLRPCGKSGPLKVVKRPWGHALPIWWWCFSSMALV